MEEHQRITTIGEIKSRYGFEIELLYRLPSDLTQRFGNPERILHTGNGYIILFRDWSKSGASVIHVGEEFREIRTICEAPDIADLDYDEITDKIILARANVFQLFCRADAELGLETNRIESCDFDGKTDETVSVADQTLFPLSPYMSVSGNLYYYDFLNKSVMSMERDENKKVIQVAREVFCFNSPIQKRATGDVYFLNVANRAFCRWANRDQRDTLYRIDTDGRLETVLVNENDPEPHNKIYDYQILEKEILYTSDHYLVKTDIGGNIVYRYPYRSLSGVNRHGGRSYILTMCRSLSQPDTLYAITHNFGEPLFAVYRIRV